MRIAEVMKEKGITSQQLADITGISKRTIDGYRSNRREPSFSVGITIALALNVEPQELLDKSCLKTQK